MLDPVTCHQTRIGKLLGDRLIFTLIQSTEKGALLACLLWSTGSWFPDGIDKIMKAVVVIAFMNAKLAANYLGGLLVPDCKPLTDSDNSDEECSWTRRESGAF